MESRNHLTEYLYVAADHDSGERLVTHASNYLSSKARKVAPWHPDFAEELVWDGLEIPTNSRFIGLRKANNYLDSLAQMVSTSAYLLEGGHPNRLLAAVPISRTGEIFKRTAQFTYIQREIQLVDEWGFYRQDPRRHLAGYSFIVNSMSRQTAVKAQEVITDLKHRADAAYSASDTWWRGLSDLILPYADHNLTHQSEVNLGIGVGLGLIDSAYRVQIKQHNERALALLDRAIGVEAVKLHHNSVKDQP